MKKVQFFSIALSLVLLSVTTFAQNSNLIPLTSNSEKAVELMRTVMKNNEEWRGNENPPLLQEILTLDPNFYFAKIYYLSLIHI